MARVVLAFALIFGGAGHLVGCWGGAALGSLSWTLVDVSDDARTLTIVHAAPHCGTRAGRPTVDEHAASVTIAVPDVTVPVTLLSYCTQELRTTTDEIHLDAPLGRRELRQPGPLPHWGTEPSWRMPDPGMEGCRKLARIPRDAPARDVTWVARRSAICTAPLPADLRRLPIMRRAATPADALPVRLRRRIEGIPDRSQPFVLRPAAARRILPGAQVWLVPGPVTSCTAAIFDGDPSLTGCFRSSLLARRGLVLVNACYGPTPRRVPVAGFVQPGVDVVRLVPREGRTRSVRVRDGSWTAGGALWPFDAYHGDERIKPHGMVRECWDR